MGLQFSSNTGYLELKSSLVGSLLSDPDFDCFFKACKVEQRTISGYVYIQPTQMFHVVIAGEVIASISSSTMKPTVIRVYRPGDMIHYFNSKSITCDNLGTTGITNGKTRVSFHFKSTDRAAKIIGIDRASLNSFMEGKPHLKPFEDFMTLDLSQFIDNSPGLATITPSQLSLFSPLLRIKVFYGGEIVKKIRCHKKAKSPYKRKKSITNDIKMGIVLYGMCKTVEASKDLNSLFDFHANSSKRAPTPNNDRKSASGSFNDDYSSPAGDRVSLMTRMKSTLNILRKNSVAPADEWKSKMDLNGPDVLKPGFMFGLENFYLRGPVVEFESVIALTNSYLGFWDFSLLNHFCNADDRFYRVIGRNYQKRVLDMVKPHIPLLSEMDKLSYAVLSSRITMKSFSAGEIVYRKEAPSDHTFIVLHGSVKETREEEEEGAEEEVMEVHRTLKFGALFGEVALVTDMPYFSTTVALEDTILLSFRKRVFEKIYMDDKNKLAEIRIKLLGLEVGMQHIIDHSKGYQLFHNYLVSNMAVENLLFYRAVSRFDHLCEQVREKSEQLRNETSKSVDLVISEEHSSTGTGSRLRKHDLIGSERELNQSSTGPNRRTSNSTERLGSAKFQRSLSKILADEEEEEKVQPQQVVGNKSPFRERKRSYILDVNETIPENEEDAISEIYINKSFNSHGVISRSESADYAVTSNDDDEFSDRNVASAENYSGTDALSSQNSLTRSYSFHKADLSRENSATKKKEGNDLCVSDEKEVPPSHLLATPMALLETTDEAEGEGELSFHEQNKVIEELDSGSVGGGFRRPSMQKKHSLLRQQLEAYVQDSTSIINERGRLFAEDSIRFGVGPQEMSNLMIGTAEEEGVKHSGFSEKIESIESTIVELQKVGKTLMEKYIHEGAEHQINIPDKMRKDTERAFSTWIATTSLHSPRKLSENKREGSPKSRFFDEEEEGFGKALDFKFLEIFKAPKNEVYKLLKADKFIRFKRTREFQNFIFSIKPQNEGDNGSYSSHNVSFVSSNHSHSTNLLHRPEQRKGSNVELLGLNSSGSEVEAAGANPPQERVGWGFEKFFASE